ncbi:MAG: nickel transporter permease [Bacillota bacterium]
MSTMRAGAEKTAPEMPFDSPWRRAWRSARRSPTTMIGTTIVLLFLLVAILGPTLAPFSPTETALANRLMPPSAEHWFGTDSLGRDLFSRILHGAKLSFITGMTVVLTAGVLGTMLGTIAGYFGGKIDEAVMRITDMFLAFPGLILAMAVAAILRPNLTNTLIAISVTWWPIYARLVRGQVLSIRTLDYVQAGLALGQSSTRLIWRHILPNALSPVLVRATLDMGGVILTAAGLSFIGFGAQPPTPEWGLMVADGRTFLMTHWWVSTVPAIAILLLVLGFNLMGDGLRDVLDPRLRR